MNKRFRTYLIIWAILFAAFNAICFIVPNTATINGVEYNKFGGAFWAGFGFINAAFIGQLICAYIALKAADLKKLFYNIPIIRLSYTGLILTLIFGVAAMIIPDLPGWICIVVCGVILVFNAISVVKAKAAADIVEIVDTKIAEKAVFIKSITVDAQSLIARAKNEEIKAECNKVYEALRYSDPMSNDALAGIENSIDNEFKAFADAVITDDTETVKSCAAELSALITDRNNKCKLVK